MNTTNTREEPRFAGGLPEFLAALERLYRLLGLEPAAARAATFADAESFAPTPGQTRAAA
jgi:hypothetical protein